MVYETKPNTWSGAARPMFGGLDDFLTVEDVAEALGVSRETVRVMCRKKRIPNVRIGRRLYIPRGVLEDAANRALAESMGWD